jgi:AcrR family transcriptional regulator
MRKPSGISSAGERLARPERERLMLAAAGQAFASRGFHGASMDDVAGAAGVTKPMLYRYFGSKDGLYAAYLRMTGRELIDRVRAPETRNEPSAVRLRAGLRAFLRYVAEHRSGWTVLHTESVGASDAEVAHEVAQLRERIVQMLTTLFNDEAFAHAFTGAAESLATWWVNQPNESEDAAIEILMSIATTATTPDPAG